MRFQSQGDELARTLLCRLRWRIWRHCCPSKLTHSLTLFPFLFFFFHIDHSGGPSLYRINQLVYALTCLRVNSIFLHPVLVQNWFSTVIYMLLGSILVCFEINFSILVMFGLSRINICLAYMWTGRLTMCLWIVRTINFIIATLVKPKLTCKKYLNTLVGRCLNRMLCIYVTDAAQEAHAAYRFIGKG